MTGVESTIDAAADGTSGALDASVAADGSAVDASAGCAPGDVSGFQPQWHHSAPFFQGACTREEITAYVEECVMQNDVSCKKGLEAGTVSQACTACILTPDDADRYGPLIVHRSWVELNVPGCLANAMNDPTGVKCGASVQAVSSCEYQACSANCPVTSAQTLSAFSACAQSADTGQCATFYQYAAACIQTEQGADAGAAVAACLSGYTPQNKSFAEQAREVIPLFCGPGTLSDAGAIKDAANEHD